MNKIEQIKINGLPFSLEFDFDGGSNGKDCLKWHNFHAKCNTIPNLFYELQVTLFDDGKEHGFSIEVFEENEGNFEGEWVDFEKVIVDTDERNNIEQLLINWSDKIIAKERNYG